MINDHYVGQHLRCTNAGPTPLINGAAYTIAFVGPPHGVLAGLIKVKELPNFPVGSWRFEPLAEDE